MIHHVFANRSNTGDWLSALGIQSLLAPLKVSEHLCDEPFIEGTLHELKTLTPNDYIVIGGGGLFMDYFTPFWQGFQPIAERVPFCIWGVGCVDLKREETKPAASLLNEIVSHAQLCVVRDELTRGYLSTCGLPHPVPCPSIVVLERPAGQGWGVLHAANHTAAGADVYEVMCRAARDFAEATGRTYRETNNRIQADSRKALQANLSLYEKSDIVLSSRLHGCIIGLATGRKVLAVSGDRKVESFMEAAGLSKWVLDIGELSLLPDRLRALAGQEPPDTFLEAARREHQSIAAAVRLYASSEIKYCDANR